MDANALEESVVTALRQLPAEKQQEVLDFANFLRSREELLPKGKLLRGLWKDVSVSEEDIAEAREEMWGNFPRERAFD
jgi:hypothetical protein